MEYFFNSSFRTKKKLMIAANKLQRVTNSTKRIGIYAEQRAIKTSTSPQPR